MVTGTAKTVPLLARTTFGLPQSVTGSAATTAVTPAASAVRSMAPRLPGFSTRWATRSRGSSPTSSVDRARPTAGTTPEQSVRALPVRDLLEGGPAEPHDLGAELPCVLDEVLLAADVLAARLAGRAEQLRAHEEGLRPDPGGQRQSQLLVTLDEGGAGVLTGSATTERDDRLQPRVRGRGDEQVRHGGSQPHRGARRRRRRRRVNGRHRRAVPQPGQLRLFGDRGTSATRSTPLRDVGASRESRAGAEGRPGVRGASAEPGRGRPRPRCR